MSYDAMGRVVGLWQCGPSTCGTANQTSRAQSYAYDWAGNLTMESDGGSGTITYGRSVAGEVTSITNETYQDQYDPANLVSNVVNGPNGPTNYTLGNGLNVYQTYDQLGRLQGRWVCNGPAALYCNGGTQIYGTSGIWKGSQMQSQQDTLIGQFSYYYDEFNRLVERIPVGQTSPDYAYGYDRYGNRFSQAAYQGGFSFNPNIDPTTNHITTSGFTYDAAGNMTNDVTNGASHSFQYDAEGNILTVDQGNTATYVYDAFNRRIEAPTSTGTTEFTYDYAGRRISAWLSPNNIGYQARIYWDNQQFAFRAGDGTNFDHQDTLGTERVRTIYNGSVGATYQSLPWGDGYTATVNNSYADQDSLHYAGLEHDAESDTEHAQFRNYDSAQGRWLSPDRYLGSYDLTNPQSLNRYAYVLNNPVSNVDPTGLDCVYIDNDTGGYEGFNSGDCNNLTEASANSSYYVDGTVNSIAFNSQSQVLGYGTSTGAEGAFDSFAGSMDPSAGPASAYLNPYTGAVSSSEQTVNVNGNNPQTPTPTSVNLSTLVNPTQLQNFKFGQHYIGPYTPPTSPNLTGDPACVGAPDAVSDIHNLERGIYQNSPQGSTDGQFGAAIWQNTTKGNEPFGNPVADTVFNAAFLGLDYFVSLGNCLQGH